MNPPSLLNLNRPVPAPRLSRTTEPRSLLDLMVDGFFMLFLLKNRYTPTDADTFRSHLREFLAGLDRGARKLELSAEDIHLAKYAFCALVDESVLMSRSSVRDSWERRPLQLEMFGDQLAGETFFERLEQLRQQGAPRLQVLEVFHMCLLLGFQGRYILEGSEKLSYLTARLGDEIAQLKGRRAAFAPQWAAPDSISHRLRAEVPLWVAGAVFALAALLAFVGLRWALQWQTEGDLAAYSQVIKVPAQSAHVTITLP